MADIQNFTTKKTFSVVIQESNRLRVTNSFEDYFFEDIFFSAMRNLLVFLTHECSG